MSPYLAYLSAHLRTQLQYRAAAAAGVVTQVFWGMVRIMVFEGFYRSSTAAQPMELPQVVAYVWLGQACFRLIPWRVEAEVADMFRSGQVAYELLRPLDLQFLWWARNAAGLIGPTLLRVAPVLALAYGFLGMPGPSSPAALGAFLVSLAFAVALASALLTALTMVHFWTIAGEGVGGLHASAVFLLSGMIVPLPFFPDAVRGVLEWLPFAGLTDMPFRFYMGLLPPSALPGVLAHQVGWTLVFLVAGRVLLRVGARRLVVQGG